MPVGGERGGGHDQCRAESFHQPGGDQGPGARGESAAGRGGGEHHHTGAEDPAVAQPVSQRAAGEEQAGEDQGVAVGDPLDPGQRGRQFPPHHRDGDVDDGHVQDDHEVARADREQRGQGPARSRRPVRTTGLGTTGTHHGNTLVQEHGFLGSPAPCQPLTLNRAAHRTTTAPVAARRWTAGRVTRCRIGARVPSRGLVPAAALTHRVAGPKVGQWLRPDAATPGSPASWAGPCDARVEASPTGTHHSAGAFDLPAPTPSASPGSVRPARMGPTIDPRSPRTCDG